MDEAAQEISKKKQPIALLICHMVDTDAEDCRKQHSVRFARMTNHNKGVFRGASLPSGHK